MRRHSPAPMPVHLRIEGRGDEDRGAHRSSRNRNVRRDASGRSARATRPRSRATDAVAGSLTAARSPTRRFASRMLQALTLEHAELSLLLCDDEVMRRLNLAHRRIDRTTDVLAFAMREGHPLASTTETLGDIVISWPTTRRQAREHGWSAERELCLLLAHGMLHLLGFDHVTRVEERRMMARAHMLMAAALGRK